MSIKPVDPALLRQLMSYGVVGIAGFVTDVGGFNLLRFYGGHGPLHDFPLTAKVISGVLATIVAWLGNRYWTFKDARRPKAHQEFILYAVVAGLGTLIAMGCLWLSHYALRLTSPLADNISANGVGLLLAVIFRFWAFRRLVFSGEKSPPVETDGSAANLAQAEPASTSLSDRAASYEL